LSCSVARSRQKAERFVHFIRDFRPTAKANGHKTTTIHPMAKRDYYEVLGVTKSATAEEIRRVYRKLARQFHPDVNKAADAQKKFTEVQEAYDVLSDAAKKKSYDQFGHAAEMRGAPGGGGGSGGPHYSWSQTGGGQVDMEDLGSMFDAFFGGMGGRPGSTRSARGRKERAGRDQDVEAAVTTEVELSITFMTAVRGGKESLRMEQGGKVKTIEVSIPKGVADGAKLRVKGAADSEVILKVRVGDHPFFRRTEVKGLGSPDLDLYLDLPLSLAEATLGATVPVPTLEGKVELTIPAGTPSGRKLRLKGRGIEDAQGRKGDLYVITRIVPPTGELSSDEADALRRLCARFPSVRPDWPESG
jgi:DnaJ-class molecular chaperone